MSKKFKSTNNLKFQIADKPHWPGSNSYAFKIGTVEGICRQTPISFDILSVSNSQPGNGHLKDFFEWVFEIAKQGNAALRFFNVREKFGKVLTEYGFEAGDEPGQFFTLKYLVSK